MEYTKIMTAAQYTMQRTGQPVRGLVVGLGNEKLSVFYPEFFDDNLVVAGLGEVRGSVGYTESAVNIGLPDHASIGCVDFDQYQSIVDAYRHAALDFTIPLVPHRLKPFVCNQISAGDILNAPGVIANLTLLEKQLQPHEHSYLNKYFDLDSLPFGDTPFTVTSEDKAVLYLPLKSMFGYAVWMCIPSDERPEVGFPAYFGVRPRQDSYFITIDASGMDRYSIVDLLQIATGIPHNAPLLSVSENK